MKSTFLVIAVCGLLFQLSTHANLQNSGASRTANELPFRLSSGYLIEVNGRIGTQQLNRKFILDTGTTMSIINAKLAEKLKLTEHGNLISVNFDRKITWGVATVPFIQVGQVSGRNVDFLVGNLANYSDLARDVDGIIGMDLLRTANFTVDYDARHIIFHSAEPGSSGTAHAPVIGCPVVVLYVQGQPLRLVLDTGVDEVVFFQGRVLKSVPGLSVAIPRGVTWGRRIRARQIVVPGVGIGNTHMEVSALLIDSPPSNLLPGIDGLIGIKALKATRVNFDFPERTLSWDLGAAQPLANATAQLEPAIFQLK
jgi:predicted aspartyl protease